MRPERILQGSLYLMSVISASLLGLGQGSPQQAMFMLLCGSVSLVFSDMLSWIRLNRTVVNLAMVAAAVLTLHDFLQLPPESQLLSIGTLLTWVQLILMFQVKNARVYGSLALFSLLQVVVASLLSVGFEFGVLLALYLCDALLFLVLYCVYRETVLVSTARRDSKPEIVASGPGESNDASWRRLLWKRPQVMDRADVAQLDRQFGGARLFGPALAMIAPGALFATFFFFCAPRTSGNTWQKFPMARSAMIGFSDRLVLHRMTDLLQNTQPVCRVTLTDPQTQRPTEVVGGIYLNGTALTQYRQGQWLPASSGPGSPRLRKLPENRPYLVQDVVLAPNQETTVFGLWPVYDLEATPAVIRVEQATRRIYRRLELDEYGRDRPFRFIAATTAIRESGQVRITPYVPAYDLPRNQADSYLEFDEQRFAGIREFAVSILQRQQISMAPDAQGHRDDVRIARALENHLRTSADFRYSTQMSTIRVNREIDPIHDFLLNHRTGHCAYFASGLALMLRSLKIPTRVVVGFRAEEYNEVGQYYLVRQRDAHAWIEALIGQESITADDLPLGESAPRGGWLRLDPTPASRGLRNQELQRGLVDKLDELFDYVQVLWNEHVVGLNRERQSRLIYDPLANRTGMAGEALSTKAWTRLQGGFQASLTWLREAVTTWPFWMAAAGGLVSAIGLGKLWRRFGARRRGQAASVRGEHPPVIGFYQRWESVLKRHGLRRHAAETQREFARIAVSQIASLRPDVPIANLARRIVNDFYRVRFGGSTLDKSEAESIEQALNILESELATEKSAGKS